MICDECKRIIRDDEGTYCAIGGAVYNDEPMCDLFVPLKDGEKWKDLREGNKSPYRRKT